jgi:hypothetical protein
MKRRGRLLYLIKSPHLAVQAARVFCWAELACIILRGGHSPSSMILRLILVFRSFLEMIDLAAAKFPAEVYEPPPESDTNAPALNVNLGGVSLSLGGAAGTGVYRTSGESSGIQADGIRGGVRSLLGKVKQGVDKIGLQ